ncbi:MAG TPA: malonyl-CoA decarboxylase [Bryobacteraceae bacterium]|nr:malonyl-CoA decarboxylase [Bryobacteraceae bacterium]
MLSPGVLLRDVWDSIANRGLDLLGRRGRAAAGSLSSLCLELLSERGEASGAALAREVADRYLQLTPVGREAFFLNLLQPEFLADPQTVIAAAEKYRDNPNSDTLTALFAVSEPSRQELFRRINLAPGGTERVVRMREDLLKMLPGHSELKSVDSDFRHLLSSWFNRGFLRIERIDWHTPAIILEKLIEHEAVHEIRGWDDLRRRLDADRRCFAFFHPALPDELLIFVEVALTRGLPPSIQYLLDGSREPLGPGRADTAVFYSISNCLDGLRGISFGNFLIKQVVAELEAENLGLKSFVTLSPIPGFRAWLNGLTLERKRELAGENEAVLDVTRAGNWHTKRQVEQQVRPVLLRLCAHYLLNERKRERALDPVAAFHLGNGAAIEQINWLADRSEKGLAQSFGLMVNYAYRPLQIERNHEAYVKQGRITVSARVRSLLEPASKK